MILDLQKLPTDTVILHQIITDLVEKMTSLENQLALLKAKRFGKSSEKLNRQIDELEHAIEDSESLSNQLSNILLEDKEDKCETEILSKKHPKRQKLPDNLERTEVILTPDPLCPTCGSEKFRTISNDISETLEYIPSSFKVIRHIRPRCACTHCETIVQAYPPSGVIDKGKAGPGLLAHILVVLVDI